MFYVYTMPVGLKIYRTFAPISCLLGCSWRPEIFKKYLKNIRIYKKWLFDSKRNRTPFDSLFESVKYSHTPTSKATCIAAPKQPYDQASACSAFFILSVESKCCCHQCEMNETALSPLSICRRIKRSGFPAYLGFSGAAVGGPMHNSATLWGAYTRTLRSSI